MGEPEAWETATLSFISWLDEENTNVPKILTSNVEEIERNCRNVLEVTKDNGTY